MIDITSKINNALLLNHGWTNEKVRHSLLTLAELYPESMIDWEEGIEEWGRVVYCGKETAYVSARCPFAFIQAEDDEMCLRISSRLGLIGVVVRDFDEKSISVDHFVLSELTRRPLTKNVSYDRASVNEIWWATV